MFYNGSVSHTFWGMTERNLALTEAFKLTLSIIHVSNCQGCIYSTSDLCVYGYTLMGLVGLQFLPAIGQESWKIWNTEFSFNRHDIQFWGHWLGEQVPCPLHPRASPQGVQPSLCYHQTLEWYSYTSVTTAGWSHKTWCGVIMHLHMQMQAHRLCSTLPLWQVIPIRHLTPAGA